MAKPQYQFGPFLLDPGKRRLARDGVPVSLTPKAFDALVVLVSRKGEKLSRAELLEQVWPDTAVGEHNLNQCIAVLRKALNDAHGQPEYIATLPGHGYSFIADVKMLGYGSRLAASPKGAAHDVTLGADAEGTEAAGDVSPEISAGTNAHWPRVIFAGSVAVAILVALLAGAYLRHRRATRVSQTQVASTPVELRRSVAVVGFENLSRQADKDWLSSALSEMIATEVGANGRLRIIPGEAVARASTELQLVPHDGLSRDTLQRISQNLNADLIITGAYTILPAPNSKFDQVRVQTCVQDTNTGETVATRAFTGSIADLFSLVASAGSSVRQELKVETISSDQAAEARAAAPSNLEAARLYAEGLTKLRNFDALGARPLLQRSAVADPLFPFVHLALADADEFLGDQVSERDSVLKAYQASSHLNREQQLQIKARYQESQHNWDDAIATYRALLTFYPDNLDYGLRLAYAESYSGKRAEALRTLDRLRALPPPISADPRIDLAEARTRSFLSDYQQALVPARRAAEKAKAHGQRLLYAHALLVQAGLLGSIGEYGHSNAVDEQARVICAELADLSCVADVYKRLAYGKIDSDPEAAAQLLRQALIIATQTGNQQQAGNIRNGLAAALYDEGRYSEAGRIDRELLAGARAQQDAFGIQMYLNNLGEVEIMQGHLAEGMKMEEEAVTVSRQSGQKVGIAAGLLDIANVLQFEGDLRGAEQHYNEAIAVLRGIGLKGNIAHGKAGLAAVAQQRGELSTASGYFEEALALLTEGASGGEDESTIADVRLADARLCVDQGRAEKAVALARQAVATFNRQKHHSDEGRARVVLAEALLANGDASDAADEAKRATEFVSGSDGRLPQAFVAIIAAQVIAVADLKPNPQNLALDLRRLDVAAAQAQSLNLVPLAMEARLAAERIAAASNHPEALVQLKALESEARSKGLLLIANKAQAAAANAPLYSASRAPASSK